MKILFVLHQFLPNHVTGTEQYVRSLALGMRARGHDVSVFALEPVLPYETSDGLWIEKDDEVDGIPIRRAGLHIDVQRNRLLAEHQNPLAVRLLRRFLNERDFDVAHVFHLRYIGIGVINELHVVGLPTVVHLMDFWFVCPNHILLRRDGALCDGPPEGGLGCIPCMVPHVQEWLEELGIDDVVRNVLPGSGPPRDMRPSPLGEARALVGRKERLLAELRRANVVLAPSKFLRGVIESNGFPQGVIRHAAYGVDPGRFGGRTKQWPAVLDQVSIGYVGSITPHKGLHVLIQGLRSVPGGGWRLTVYGDTKTHPEYTERILDLVGDDPRIRFCPAFAPGELGSVLQQLDLLCVPSLWYENTPFTVLEAQMMGIPVLASDLGGISECVEHGRDGYLFEAGNEADLADKVKEILADPGRLPQLAGRGGTRTLDDNLDEFLAIYADLAPPAGATAPSDRPLPADR